MGRKNSPPIRMFFANQQRQFLASNMYLCVVFSCFFVLDECKVYHMISNMWTQSISINIYQVSRIAAIAISINQCYHIRIHFFNAAVKILWFQGPLWFMIVISITKLAAVGIHSIL